LKALRWYGRKDVRYEDAPEPLPGERQIKAKIEFAGICGTDLREYSSGPCMISPAKAPVTLGHEFSGRVVQLGKGVKGFKVGDRVTGLGYWACGECYYCKRMQYNICPNQGFSGLTENGCMAEYMVAPEYAYYRLPDSVSDECGALVEPLAVGLHAVRKSDMHPGDTVAIVGDGTIGLSVVLVARAAGAAAVYIVSKHPGRGSKALSMGVTAVIDSRNEDPVKQIQRLTGGLGADVTFECVGNPDTAQLAVDMTRRDGTAVIIGVFDRSGSFHFADVVFGEKRIVGSSIYVREAEAVITLLADKRIDPGLLITSQAPLKGGVKLGFEKLLGDKDNNLKILLKIS
jgi:(R,R)-butanediol dehydrogenase/meso-butanediol dehydrogenase/diacetyl reductase